MASFLVGSHKGVCEGGPAVVLGALLAATRRVPCALRIGHHGRREQLVDGTRQHEIALATALVRAALRAVCSAGRRQEAEAMHCILNADRVPTVAPLSRVLWPAIASEVSGGRWQ